MIKIIKKIFHNIDNLFSHNILITKAVKGNPDAQLDLAKFYLLQKQNYVEAYAWADVAYLRNHQGATEIKKLAEERLTNLQIKEAWDKARQYKTSFT